MRECIETTLERMLVTAVVFLKSHGVVFLEAWLGRVFKKLGTYIPGIIQYVLEYSRGPDFMPFILPCQKYFMPVFSREHNFF